MKAPCIFLTSVLLSFSALAQERPADTSAVLRWNEETHEIEYGSRRYSFVSIPNDYYVIGATYDQRFDSRRDEHPLHASLIYTSYIGKTEVPQWLWQAVMKKNPSLIKGDDLPVDMVTWYDCINFLNILDRLTESKFFLPGEKLWEAAARGDNGGYYHKFSGSDDLSEVAWYLDNSESRIHPVGEKAPNKVGLYDMCGNVEEWCYDWYGPYRGNNTGFRSPSSGTYKVIRGGSCYSSETDCRVSARSFADPETGRTGLGFRLAYWKERPRTPEAEEKAKKDIVESRPEFNGGGADKFSLWVNERLIYPKESKKNKIAGTVLLTFTVDTDGRLTDIRVLHGIDGYLEGEAVRVVSKSPRWKPGYQNGEPVRVNYTFPVIFSLR